MRSFNSSDLKTFEELVKLSQFQLKRVVSTFLKKHYKKVIETKDYVIAEGDIPIALCAHLDTVFKTPPEEIYFDSKHNVLWSPDGLGADDRAGVFAILQIIRSGLHPHIIFTTDEELGGIGASKLAMEQCPFSDLRYIIELDRRGANDCVFYNCDNKRFTEYVESFGFTTNFGTFSDISCFCPEWKIAGVNLSIGYRDEHSVVEILFVGQMLHTIEQVKKMLQETDIPYFEYIPDETATYWGGWGAYDFGYGNTFYNHSAIIKCHKCGKSFLEEEMFPTVMQDKTTKFFCPDCLVDLNWCDTCNSPYEKLSPEQPDGGECPLCQELKENKRK